MFVNIKVVKICQALKLYFSSFIYYLFGASFEFNWNLLHQRNA